MFADLHDTFHAIGRQLAGLVALLMMIALLAPPAILGVGVPVWIGVQVWQAGGGLVGGVLAFAASCFFLGSYVAPYVSARMGRAMEGLANDSLAAGEL